MIHLRLRSNIDMLHPIQSNHEAWCIYPHLHLDLSFNPSGSHSEAVGEYIRMLMCTRCAIHTSALVNVQLLVITLPLPYHQRYRNRDTKPGPGS